MKNAIVHNLLSICFILCNFLAEPDDGVAFLPVAKSAALQKSPRGHFAVWFNRPRMSGRRLKLIITWRRGNKVAGHMWRDLESEQGKEDRDASAFKKPRQKMRDIF